MRVGFTGTRHGMDANQKQLLRAWLRDKLITDFHHGDCIGADADAVQIVLVVDPEITIHAHPCNLAGMRAHAPADHVYDELPPLVRNQNIVDAVDVLLAAPDGPPRLRSGTWATVRYALNAKKEIFIFNPAQAEICQPAC